jgi:hypothetical protein
VLVPTGVCVPVSRRKHFINLCIDAAQIAAKVGRPKRDCVARVKECAAKVKARLVPCAC